MLSSIFISGDFCFFEKRSAEVIQYPKPDHIQRVSVFVVQHMTQLVTQLTYHHIAGYSSIGKLPILQKKVLSHYDLICSFFFFAKQSRNLGLCQHKRVLGKHAPPKMNTGICQIWIVRECLFYFKPDITWVLLISYLHYRISKVA